MRALTILTTKKKKSATRSTSGPNGRTQKRHALQENRLGKEAPPTAVVGTQGESWLHPLDEGVSEPHSRRSYTPDTTTDGADVYSPYYSDTVRSPRDIVDDPQCMDFAPTSRVAPCRRTYSEPILVQPVASPRATPLTETYGRDEYEFAHGYSSGHENENAVPSRKGAYGGHTSLPSSKRASPTPSFGERASPQMSLSGGEVMVGQGWCVVFPSSQQDRRCRG